MDIPETAEVPVQAAISAAAALNRNGDTLSRHMVILVIQLAVIIFAVRVGGSLLRRLNLPSVLGELLSGIVIGPYLLGGIPLPALGLPQGLFPKAPVGIAVSPELYGFATVASLILLFVVGLETDFRQFIKYSVAGTVIGLGGVVVSFLAGNFSAILFLGKSEMGFFHPSCLFLATISTATSVGITARILSERKRMDSPEGVTILASAIIDDILGIIVLGISITLIDVMAIRNGGAFTLPWSELILVSGKTLLACLA
ncbi:MAG: cation:proton antiporter, partial [Planctomycetota bacterium]|nr:cation:proton antiporter [Planctomycetota bacterium]